MLAKAWKDKKDDPERPYRLKTEGVDTSKMYCQDELSKGKRALAHISPSPMMD